MYLTAYKKYMEKEGFPEEFWRGIANKDFISQGYVLASAFQFDDEIREDNFRELSINWNDNEQALEKVLNQTKSNGKLQFSGGAAKLSLSSVKMVLKAFIDDQKFDYERRVVDGNEFHGNLLISSDLNKQLRTQISNGLALVAGTNIINRD